MTDEISSSVTHGWIKSILYHYCSKSSVPSSALWKVFARGSSFAQTCQAASIDRSTCGKRFKLVNLHMWILRVGNWFHVGWDFEIWIKIVGHFWHSDVSTNGWFRVKGTHLRTDRLKFVFFGPKPVSWTTWDALSPILALPGPFKGVFGPRVGSGAPGGPNFWNNQMDPFFFIPLFFLHLNS